MTEELLALMFEQRNQRMRASMEANKPANERERAPRRVSDQELFAQMGVKVGVV